MDAYYKYGKAKIKWDYVWGKLEDYLFHCVSFNVSKNGGGHLVSTHGSFHTNKGSEYFESIGRGSRKEGRGTYFDTHRMKLIVSHNAYYVYHMTEGRNYVSFPSVNILGLINIGGTWAHLLTGSGWYDEEEVNGEDFFYKEGDELKVNNWDWMGIKLNNKDIMVYNLKKDRCCTIMQHKRSQATNDFELTEDRLVIPVLNLDAKIIPVVDEKIFHPVIGMKYSEQPVRIFINGKEEGYGMRERTYGGIKIDDNLLYGGKHGD